MYSDSEVTVTATFNPDSDGDGLSDSIENNGPDDGNGTRDAVNEGNVATFRTIHRNWTPFVSEAGTSRGQIALQENRSQGDVSAGIFGCGFLSFRGRGLTPGANTTAQLTTPSTMKYNRYYKYGQTPSNPQTGGYKFAYVLYQWEK